ncbi:hypothetical protein B0H63DRAFT_527249 [Podospora didyma]|uniref:Uncharacterized protein n=1 Tax=Podospora didyma TaxID=330526 RepID=A0AAE0KAM9_9PEZI|nr:hypothetical protein B0H63DRAFT_527249 [Podospora didyma]
MTATDRDYPPYPNPSPMPIDRPIIALFSVAAVIVAICFGRLLEVLSLAPVNPRFGTRNGHIILT